MPGTFLGMANLKGLDFSVNVVRKVKTFLSVIYVLKAVYYISKLNNVYQFDWYFLDANFFDI